MWSMPKNGLPRLHANALPNQNPTTSDPTSPGPRWRRRRRPRRVDAGLTEGVVNQGADRVDVGPSATSGTTPPKRAWASTWLESTDERTS